MKPTDYKLISELTAKMAEGEILEGKYNTGAWIPLTLQELLREMTEPHAELWQYRTQPAEPATPTDYECGRCHGTFLLVHSTGAVFCPFCGKSDALVIKAQAVQPSAEIGQLPPSVPAETHPKHELCVDCGEVSTTGRDENGKPLCCECQAKRNWAKLRERATSIRSAKPREWWILSRPVGPQAAYTAEKYARHDASPTQEIVHVQEVK
jgi:uncharacterized Zn finger protein (UPF0148 family)